MSAWRDAGGPPLPGMLVRPIMADGSIGEETGRVIRSKGMPIVFWPHLNETRGHHPTEHLEPVETDGPTIGAMAQHVRELHDDPHAHVWWSKHTGSWAKTVHAREGPGLFDYPTEAEAWAAAYRAVQSKLPAPEKT